MKTWFEIENDLCGVYWQLNLMLAEYEAHLSYMSYLETAEHTQYEAETGQSVKEEYSETLGEEWAQFNKAYQLLKDIKGLVSEEQLTKARENLPKMKNMLGK